MPVLEEAVFTVRNGDDPQTALTALAAWPWFDGRLPDRVRTGSKRVTVDRDWTERIFFDVSSAAYWGPGDERLILWGKQRCLYVEKNQAQVTPTIALELLRSVPFETAVGVSPYRHTWSRRLEDLGKPLHILDCGWGMGHADHGWACFLRGRGHEQVVSRRFLHHGPWRTVYLPDEDLTMVQFHDLDADVHAAVRQVRQGHPLMGYSMAGGIFFHRGDAHPFQEFTGNYDRRTRTFIYQMLDRKLTWKLISDLGWLRLHNRDGLGPLRGKPIHHIRLCYWDLDAAKEDLEFAWRSEFEVSCMIEGKEVRIDEGYESTWVAPDWVKRLQDKEGF